MSEFRVDVLPLGRGDVPGPELFWMSGWDEWHTLLFQSVLLRGDGVTALVNTGPARDLEPMNAHWEKVLGARARMRREPGEFVVDQLARFGLAPEDVTHVVLTPLQLYTVSNVALFTNARICVAERGWVHFHTTHAHPHDNRATSLPDDVLVHLVTEAWPRVRLLADEDELAPGLRTWWSGVHHRASVVVEADTPRGVVAISDSFFVLDNVEKNIPIGINENMYEAIAAYERVRRTADVIVPLYDPRNLERFAGGRVA
ncbi:hypothetical protein ACWDWO_10470 [Actinopolymorpha singaporensis]|uniref:Uncharacterized protein n=1 Tax=Actinopolymorpha singaporensis TaxID=117157 RepID=A0A1H1YZC5_9ACTN|nr:hypothetical protein [Actinopolymorpha singaporensis]SDT26296.1 hypothetical protein SAMN04489717_5765 [Actinopolymorpha singaporensis]